MNSIIAGTMFVFFNTVHPAPRGRLCSEGRRKDRKLIVQYRLYHYINLGSGRIQRAAGFIPSLIREEAAAVT